MSIEIPDKLFFRIGEVAELIGVESHVLRYWEQEFRMRPQRSPSGQRMYRRTDIQRFGRIKQLLHDDGYTIAGARKALRGGDGDKDAPVELGEDAARVLERITTAREHIGRLRDGLNGPLDAKSE